MAAVAIHGGRGTVGYSIPMVTHISLSRLGRLSDAVCERALDKTSGKCRGVWMALVYVRIASPRSPQERRRHVTDAKLSER